MEGLRFKSGLFEVLVKWIGFEKERATWEPRFLKRERVFTADIVDTTVEWHPIEEEILIAAIKKLGMGPFQSWKNLLPDFQIEEIHRKIQRIGRITDLAPWKGLYVDLETL